MTEMLVIIAPVFTMIIMGQLAVRFRLVDAGGLRGLNDFVFFAALPCLLFRSVAGAPSFSVLHIASAYFSAGMVVYLVALAAAMFILRTGLASGAMVALNAAYGNTVLMGVPVIVAAFGAEGLPPLLGILSLQSALLLPGTTVLLEIGSARQTNMRILARITALGLIRNPVILSIAAAVVWRTVGFAIPRPLDGFLLMLGGAAPPIALFCLGASLPGFRLGGVWREAVLAASLKLVAMPIMVFLVCRAVGITGLPLTVAVLTAGLPTGANAFMIARRAATNMEASAATVVLATAAALVTLPLILGWMRP